MSQLPVYPDLTYPIWNTFITIHTSDRLHIVPDEATSAVRYA